MTARTRVKICGITRLEDASRAALAGADAIGFVFVPASARAISVAAARDIDAALPAFVTRVGLFLDADPGDVEAACLAVPGLVPQFHGRESATYCEGFGIRYLKALGLGEAGALPDAKALGAYARAAGFLFDSHVPGELGGTGVAFDWGSLAAGRRGDTPGAPLILAGGLHAGNVGRAIDEVRPWAVDVSSGVESSKGIKDHDAMRAFLDEVRAADARRDRDAGANAGARSAPGTHHGTNR